jgi:hypothetical protein
MPDSGTSFVEKPMCRKCAGRVAKTDAGGTSFMWSRLSQRRPSPSLVISLLALFVAMGGTSYAVARNSIGAKQLKKGAVTTSKIKSNAVTTGKVKNGSLRARDFKAGDLPAGERGERGLQGIQGSKGETGTFGAVTAQFTQATADLPDGASTSVNAFCPDGQRGIGGGARGDATSSEETHVTSSRPAISAANTEPPLDGQSFTGWRATVVNTAGGVAAGIRPEVWVICAAP